MTRSRLPIRSPLPLRAVPAVGALLALTVLHCAQRVPVPTPLAGAAGAGAGGYGLPGVAWQPPAGSPPFSAILFLPATWLPAGALRPAIALSVAGLLALLLHLARRVPRPGPVLAVTAAGLLSETVTGAPLPGPAILALACLVLWDLGRVEGALGKGFALGVAAGCVLSPALFLLHCLVTGRIRTALTGLGAFAGTVALGALVLPEASGRFWARDLTESLLAARPWQPDPERWLQALYSPYPLLVLALLAAAVRRPDPEAGPPTSPGAGRGGAEGRVAAGVPAGAVPLQRRRTPRPYQEQQELQGQQPGRGALPHRSVRSVPAARPGGVGRARRAVRGGAGGADQPPDRSSSASTIR